MSSPPSAVAAYGRAHAVTERNKRGLARPKEVRPFNLVALAGWACIAGWG